MSKTFYQKEGKSEEAFRKFLHVEERERNEMASIHINDLNYARGAFDGLRKQVDILSGRRRYSY